MSDDRTASAVRLAPLERPFDVELPMPGSKSHANRALIAACLAEGTTVLEGATPCDDVVLLIGNLEKLGFPLAWLDRRAGLLEIQGGLAGLAEDVGGAIELDCGLAGTTLRFLTSLACLVPGEWIVTGNERMRERPIGDLVNALSGLGARIEDRDGHPPVRIHGGSLAGGSVVLDASRSSQFLTSLLLIAPALPQGLEVELPGPLTSPTYVELTRTVLADFGATVRQEGTRFQVEAGPYRSPGRYPIEGDWSAAGAFEVLARLTSSRFRGTNLMPDSRQGDRLLGGLLDQLEQEGDQEIDCTPVPDQLMNLAVFAASRSGSTRFFGAANLRHKECDRLAVLCRELQRAGIRIEEHEDGVLVHGPSRPRATRFDPEHDHRMAMAFAILGATTAGMEIDRPDCVAKSYPEFFADWRSLLDSPACLVIVGMRGAGKTTFAVDLARELGLEAVDSDARFESQHGPIGAFVAERGWPALRDEEQRIVAAELRPGRVVSLGGGAVESRRTRRLLTAPAPNESSSVVIWLDEPVEILWQRLAVGDRPALTDLDPRDELGTVLARRRPLFAEVSDLVLPDAKNRQERVELARQLLTECCSFARNG